jgi:hypothetical protein
MDDSDTPAGARERGAPRFGKLHPVSASSVEGWTHEGHDFTPWLAENLGLLGEELGLSRQLKEREYAVGRYSLDLLLEDAQGRTVIVENQFGQTDHDHLGKLLTYCGGAEADVVVWISETLTEEHVAALEWLNESTVAGVGFFGVELELLKIDDSKPAPHFRVVVKPNEWVKRVRPEPTPGPVEWSWEAFGDALGISQERIRVGRELCERLEAAIRDRGLPWKPVFRKGLRRLSACQRLQRSRRGPLVAEGPTACDQSARVPVRTQPARSVSRPRGVVERGRARVGLDRPNGRRRARRNQGHRARTAVSSRPGSDAAGCDPGVDANDRSSHLVARIRRSGPVVESAATGQLVERTRSSPCIPQSAPKAASAGRSLTPPLSAAREVTRARIVWARSRGGGSGRVRLQGQGRDSQATPLPSA